MSVFSTVQANNVGRSVFDLSHTKRLLCDMGQLVPILFLECVPGDVHKIGIEAVTRFQPLVAPILDSVDMTVHYFFVPTRLLMDGKDDWEIFLSGGPDGKDSSVSLPVWQFSYFNGSPTEYRHPFSNHFSRGRFSLWDYFGLPVLGDEPSFYFNVRDKNNVLAFAQRAYNLVWNEYYRDENLVDEVSLSNSTLLYRAWKKDYFTSSLPWQQRGTAPALPISGKVPVSFGSSFGFSSPSVEVAGLNSAMYAESGTDVHNLTVHGSMIGSNPVNNINFSGFFGSATADLSGATTFDIATLRQAMQIQRWMELNARGGVRYTEFLRSHFGVSPRDEVLQRPEYIGGTKSHVVVSEVLQTSSTNDTSPQGNLAGHGLGATQDFICSYHCKEFGYIIGIASWMPKGSYQQGVPRMFSRKSKYDFYFPEFAHLSEQAVNTGEIYAQGTDEDKEIFGYQSAYNEMRSMQSINCAGMRDTYKYWHLGRIFSSKPSLNAGFLTTNPEYSGGVRKDIFAVQNEPGLIVEIGNLIKSVRPLPVYGTPGFVDHVGRM